MATGIIYLDIDDEITSAAARIRALEATQVALVLPYGSRVATSRMNFRLLAREADRSTNARLSIVAGDAATRALAASAGLPVFASVAEYEAALGTDGASRRPRRWSGRRHGRRRGRTRRSAGPRHGRCRGRRPRPRRRRGRDRAAPRAPQTAPIRATPAPTARPPSATATLGRAPRPPWRPLRSDAAATAPPTAVGAGLGRRSAGADAGPSRGRRRRPRIGRRRPRRAGGARAGDRRRRRRRPTSSCPRRRSS